MFESTTLHERIDTISGSSKNYAIIKSAKVGDDNFTQKEGLLLAQRLLRDNANESYLPRGRR